MQKYSASLQSSSSLQTNSWANSCNVGILGVSVRREGNTRIRMGKGETHCDFHLNGKDEGGGGRKGEEVGMGRQLETDQGAIVVLNINTGKYAGGKKLVAVWKCNKQIIPHRRNAYEYGNAGDVISFRIVSAGGRDAGTWTAELYDLNTLESRSRLPITISCGITVNPRGSGCCQTGWKSSSRSQEKEGGFGGSVVLRGGKEEKICREVDAKTPCGDSGGLQVGIIDGDLDKLLGGERSESVIQEPGSKSLGGQRGIDKEEEESIKGGSASRRIGVTAGKDGEKVIEKKRNVTGGLDRRGVGSGKVNASNLWDKVEGRGGGPGKFGAKIIQESKVGRGGKDTRSVIRKSVGGKVGEGDRRREDAPGVNLIKGKASVNGREKNEGKLNTVTEELGRGGTVIADATSREANVPTGRGVNYPEVKAERRVGKSLEEKVPRGAKGVVDAIADSKQAGSTAEARLPGAIGGRVKGQAGIVERLAKKGFDNLNSRAQEKGSFVLKNGSVNSGSTSSRGAPTATNTNDRTGVLSNRANAEAKVVSNRTTPAKSGSKPPSAAIAGGAKPISKTAFNARNNSNNDFSVNQIATSPERTPKQCDSTHQRRPLKKTKGEESNSGKGPSRPQAIHLSGSLTKSNGEAINCHQVSEDANGGAINCAKVKGGLKNTAEKIYVREVKVVEKALLGVAGKVEDRRFAWKSVSKVKGEEEGKGINGSFDRGADELDMSVNIEKELKGGNSRGANRVSQLVDKFRMANGETSKAEVPLLRKPNFTVGRKTGSVSARIASVEIKTRTEEKVITAVSRKGGAAGGAIALRRSSLRRQGHAIDLGNSVEEKVGDGFAEDFGSRDLALAEDLKDPGGGSSEKDLLLHLLSPAGHLEETDLEKVDDEEGGGREEVCRRGREWKDYERVNAWKIGEGSVEEHYEEDVFIVRGEAAEVGKSDKATRSFMKPPTSSDVDEGEEKVDEEKGKSLGFSLGENREKEVKSEEEKVEGGRRIKENFISPLPSPPPPPIASEGLSVGGTRKIDQSSSIIAKTPDQTDRTDIVGKLGERIELDVRPWISPSAPNVQWKLPNKKIEEGESLLVLPNLSFAHSGKYEADFSQPQGSKAKKVFSVNVEGPPDVLIGLTARKLMDDKIEVSWNGCTFDGGSNVTHYILEHDGQEFETSELSMVLRTNNNTGEGKPEVFKVAAVNKHGRGEWSTVEYCDCVKIQEGGFDAYSKLEELGKGRFGHVFRVEKCGKFYAGKFIKCIRAVDREKAKQEVKILSLLRGHEKLVQIIGAFQLNREVIILTELLSGGELFERIVADDFNLTESKCREFVQEILQGIEFVHSKSIVHLDIKPENILITPGGLKIIDFGLSQIYDPNNKQCVLFGTPEFVSPEIINYEPIGFYCDIWSIGVVTYVLVSGLSPFMGDSDTETFSNVTRGEFDFDDDAFDEVSQECLVFIRGCLSLPHTNRPSSKECLDHPWMQQTISDAKIRKDKLKSFVLRRKWQKTGNAIRAIGRLRSYGSTSSGPEES